MRKSALSNVVCALKHSALPILAAVFPAVFHYANNSRLVLFASFVELCAILAIFGLFVFIILVLLTRGKYAQSAVGAAMILAFFHTYGYVFDGLHSLDIIQLETYNFMPFYIFVGIYIGWQSTGIGHTKTTQIWNAAGLILGVLVLFNLLKIVVIQLDSSREQADTNRPLGTDSPIPTPSYPDIYYLIFDEAAGFEVARQYWDYDGVDNFVDFLHSVGFYVAEFSHADSTHTLRELATRLNYEFYPIGDEYFGMYNDAIAQNRVMDYLQAYGYNLIAYDERRTPYPTTDPLPVEELVETSPEGIERSDVSFWDDYKILVLQNTLLRSLISLEHNTRIHLKMILYTTDVVASEWLASPKFVYVHLMLPHVPFAFTERGGFLSNQTEYFNWNRYLDNYKFSIRIMQKMVENILASTNPDNLPVIIIQSDHGARNQNIKPYVDNLENYPEGYKTWIINALLLPDCDDAPLSQDMDPINTFPIVFNCYFGDNLPVK